MDKKIRVLVAKPGLDGHDRGAKVIASTLRDAGFEVIYSGLHQTPEMIVEAALQEDVDVIGISLLSGSHNEIIDQLMSELDSEGAKGSIPVILGGIIPQGDMESLRQKGIKAIFTPKDYDLMTVMDKIMDIILESKFNVSSKVMLT